MVFKTDACGTWLNQTSIPSDQLAWARSFSTILEKNIASMNSTLGAAWPTLSPFYKSCLDTNRIDELDLSPVQPMLQQISDANDLTSLFSAAGTMRKSYGAEALLSIGVTVDSKSPGLSKCLCHTVFS